MNKRTILSVAIILLAVASVGGATMAWFTDEAKIDGNTFEAGTVSLTETDIFNFTDKIKDNWNPGECVDKVVKIKYEGSKNAFLRMQIKETWSGIDPDSGNENGDYYQRNAPNVTWTGWDDTNWTFYQGWWYYDGGGAVKTTIGEGADTFEIGNIAGKSNLELTIMTKVCLDGATVGNNYQGAVYTIDATFQAIQASSADVWDWDSVDFETGLE